MSPAHRQIVNRAGVHLGECDCTAAVNAHQCIDLTCTFCEHVCASVPTSHMTSKGQQLQQSAITPPVSSTGVWRLALLSMIVCLDVFLRPTHTDMCARAHTRRKKNHTHIEREGPAAGDRLLLSVYCQPVQHTAFYPILIFIDFLPCLQT